MSATFCGIGGDQLFFRAPLSLAAADYAKRHGVSVGLLRLSMEISVSQRVSLWRSLSTSIQMGLLARQWEPWKQVGKHLRLVSKETLETARRPDSPFAAWLRPLENLPPGKRQQVQIVPLSPDPNTASSAQHRPEIVLPLASQPLVETCLKIPTYVLASRGVERGAARRAFEKDLPSAIVHRFTKGGVDAYLHTLLERNLTFVRELMLEGVLVREKLLDRSKLEKALSTEHGCSTFEATEIVCDHLNTEIWARSWV